MMKKKAIAVVVCWLTVWKSRYVCEVGAVHQRALCSIDMFCDCTVPVQWWIMIHYLIRFKYHISVCVCAVVVSADANPCGVGRLWVFKKITDYRLQEVNHNLVLMAVLCTSSIFKVCVFWFARYHKHTAFPLQQIRARDVVHTHTCTNSQWAVKISSVPIISERMSHTGSVDQWWGRPAKSQSILSHFLSGAVEPPTEKRPIFNMLQSV